MLFNSYPFLFGFLPATLVLTWLARRFTGAGMVILILAVLSYLFYLSGERIYPWLIVVSIAGNYASAFGMTALPRSAARTIVFYAGLALNLVLLGYFKYFDFFTDQLAALGLGGPAARIILPVGISFFTFTQIAFLVDTYRGEVNERSPLSYFLFVTFFPHLIAGPILHHKEMMPQFRAVRREGGWTDLYAGLAVFTIGLAKKTLIADQVGATSSALFNAVHAGAPPTFVEAWAAALAYTAQIYFDFSGYSDMAIGISRMIGIDLPLNFNSPYKSTSIIDFWRRWHITLSRFLRDYLYITLGGSRRGTGRRYLNLFVTMVLGGAWHGAGWTFVAWGALHGAMLTVAHLWASLSRSRPTLRLPVALAWGLTFLGVVVAWVPFRAPDFSTAASIWRGMIGGNGLALPNGGMFRVLARILHLPVREVNFMPSDLAFIAAALLLAFLAPNSQQIARRFAVGLDSPGYSATPTSYGGRLILRVDAISMLLVGALLGLAVRAIGGYSEFIYFQF